MKRTNTCGELAKKDIGKKVTLCGWNHSRRDHGGIIFIDLRDRYGITQIVLDPKHNKKLHSEAEHLSREDVLQAKGTVRYRGKGLENPKLATGEIEVLIDELNVLNKAATPPFEIEDRLPVNEDLRLKYRYLDLRRQVMQQNIILRHKMIKVVRDYFNELGFLEIETPLLAKSTPEGARDYLVPSRVHAGKFYALPQSPQLFKQLLMVAGFDRYLQIAKCLRDEDLRADRQPEFTQIDIEMSFIDEEDIYSMMDGMIKKIWKDVLNIDVKTPIKRITYEEAMGRYGSDKPDLRFGLELVNVSDIAKDSDFEVFKNVTKSGGCVKAINVKSAGDKFSRSDIDGFISFVQIYGAKGLAWAKITDKGMESSIVKYFNEKTQKELIKKLNAEKGDLLLFVADHKHFVVNAALGALRLEIAKRLSLINPNTFDFTWVTDFPLFEFDEDLQKHIAVHHPFTSPKDADMPLLDTDPLKVKAKAYDLTLNGVEIGGGSIRIHRSELQQKMFDILGITRKEAEGKFGFLLDAFKYGAPPHGGIAFGVDRLAAIMTGNESIREVIAFPKNKAAESLMEGSPSEVSDEQLKDLSLKLDIVKVPEKNALFDRIIETLKNENITYELMEHKPVNTSEEAAKVRGTELKQGAKALVCKAGNNFVQLVISAATELDLDRAKRVIGSAVSLANADDVKVLSGVSIGAVPPFGNLFGIKVYVDKRLTENEQIAFNAGMHTKSIKMRAKDLVRVTGAKVVEISK